MTIQVSLTDEDEAFVRRRIASGHNHDADDVIHEALRLLDEQERQRVQLRAALAIGLDQIERGETVPWTPDLLSDLFEEVLGETTSQDAASAHIPR